MRAASSVLGYDLARCHVALIAWAGSPGAVSGLERVAEAQLRARDAVTTLAVPIGTFALWAWGAIIGSDADPAAAAPAAPPVPTDIRIALGLPGRGIDGFRRSHAQATRAERLARLAGDRAAHVTNYAEISAIAMLTEDLDGARHFVERELGPPADSTSQVTALRETLLQYLEQERSISTVAAHLHLARGTVAYRVKKAEAMLGHEVGQRRSNCTPLSSWPRRWAMPSYLNPVDKLEKENPRWGGVGGGRGRDPPPMGRGGPEGHDVVPCSNWASYLGLGTVDRTAVAMRLDAISDRTPGPFDRQEHAVDVGYSERSG